MARRDDYEEGAKLRALRLELEQPAGVLAAIGAVMVAESQDAFRTQKFGGEAWRPRAPINVMGIVSDFIHSKNPPSRRFDRRPALRDTGRLAASIAFRVTGSAVEVGTVVPYAEAHQTGGTTTSKTWTEAARQRARLWLLKNQDSDIQEALGFLLNPDLVGTRFTGRVPQRRFLGVTKQTQRDITEVIRMRLADG